MAKSNRHRLAESNRDNWADVFTCSWSDDGRLNMNGFHKDSPLCLRLYLRSIKPENWELALKLITTSEGHSFVDGIGITFPQEYEYSSSEEEENNAKGPIPNDEVEFFAGRLSKCRLKRTDFLRVVNHCLSERRRHLLEPLDGEAGFLKYVSGERLEVNQNKATDSDAGSQQTVAADPRNWDSTEVTQWVARTLFPCDPTATIPDLQMTGAEICTRPERWFTDKFPAGLGRVLYSDLQQRRDDTARQRRFGGRMEESERVLETTSAAFLVSAFLMSMILTLMGARRHRKRAEHILQYLRSLIEVTRRRSKNKELLRPDNFSPDYSSHNMIEQRKESSSTAASVVYGATTIAISSETYRQVVTSASEAMEVIGAPLEIQIEKPFLRRIFAVASKAFRRVGVALTTGVVAIIIVAAALFGVNQNLVAAFDVLDESEKNKSVFKINYSQALIFLPEVLQESEMTEKKLEQIIERVTDESSIQDVERNMMKLLPYTSQLSPRIPPSMILHVKEAEHFDYEAKKWLTADSILNVNDTLIIAYAQFELRNLLRDVFMLGVVGSVKSGKNMMVKSVFPKGERSSHQTRACPYDVMLYDGSSDIWNLLFQEGTLPVLLFPSGEGKVMDAAHGLCTGVCGAFICMVEYVAGKKSPDIGALSRVAGLHVPVLLCVNKCSGVKDQQEASQILDRYKTQVIRDFGSLKDLTEVVLTDFQTTHRPAWLTGAEGVKYWIREAIQNHKRYASNVEAEFEHVLRF